MVGERIDDFGTSEDVLSNVSVDLANQAKHKDTRTKPISMMLFSSSMIAVNS